MIMKKATKRNTIAIATALTTLLSATAVLADATSSKTVEAPKMAQTQQCETNGSFKSHLDSLVASGTLDQDKEDSIQSAITTAQLKHDADKGQPKNHQNGQINDGTKNHVQEDAIQD